MTELVDTVGPEMADDDAVDIDVRVCPAHRRPSLWAACSKQRWLCAGTPQNSSTIWLLEGDSSTPMYSDRVTRVADAISHETMHIVLRHVEDQETSTAYDDLLKSMQIPAHLHRIVQGLGEGQ